MRFLADENVSRLVVDRLRSAKFDVQAMTDIGPGTSDPDVLEAARTKDRIVITEDRDFGELVVRQRLAVGGIILLELDHLSNAAEADRVPEVVLSHAAKLAVHLVVIEPGRIRLRPLPSTHGGNVD
jgi:predicted nuclease of predicted toxin-antitoxin system